MSNTGAAPSKRSWLRRLLLWFAGVLVIGFVVLVVGVGLLYRAATAELPEYEALLEELDEREASGDLDKERQALESQVAALVSEAQSEPRWQTVITADQLNGWLAVQLPVDFPNLEKKGIRQPRVMLGDGSATLACRARWQGSDAVVSAVAAPLVAEDGWVGFEIKSVRIGQLAMPVASMIEMADKTIKASAAKPGAIRYRWGEVDGNPALLFDLEQVASTAEFARRLDAIKAREGELLISGVTEGREPAANDAATDPAPGLPEPIE